MPSPEPRGGAAPKVERLELRLPAATGSLATMRRELRAWLSRARLSDAAEYDVLVAAGEAAANAVEHAYGPTEAEFGVDAEMTDGEIVISVRDEGRWRAARGTHRGRGLSMMRELMDDVRVDSDERGTVITMRRRIETEA